MFARESHIVLLQKKDHVRMEQLLKTYEAGDLKTRTRTYDAIVQLVTTHAFAEETVLFPAARRLLPPSDALTAEIEQQHQVINELMVEMQDLSPGDIAFEERAQQLFALLRADARQEEDELLTALAAATDQGHLRSIGATWATARRTAPNRPHPRISRRPPGNLLAGLPLAITDRVQRMLGRLWHRTA